MENERKDRIKTEFSQLFTQVSKLHKESVKKNNESYITGRKAGIDEVMNWFINSQNGNIKFVQSTAFVKMLEEKIAIINSKINLENDEDREEEKREKDREKEKVMSIDDFTSYTIKNPYK